MDIEYQLAPFGYNTLGLFSCEPDQFTFLVSAFFGPPLGSRDLCCCFVNTLDSHLLLPLPRGAIQKQDTDTCSLSPSLSPLPRQLPDVMLMLLMDLAKPPFLFQF